MATSFSLESDTLIGSGHPGQRAPAYFPIERELRFRLTGKQNPMMGSGKTIHIGSKRVLFRTDQALPFGRRVEMAISWPVQLNQKCDLKLIASGKIMRAELGVVAVSIERYEFRTVGSHGLAM